MAKARIFQEAKSSMSSGRGRSKRWVLEHEATEPRRADPLMGWAGSGDTESQITLVFPTAEAAIAYAEREGLEYNLIPTPDRKLRLQAYSDNFQ
jgi:hypothetical protein